MSFVVISGQGYFAAVQTEARKGAAVMFVVAEDRHSGNGGMTADLVSSAATDFGTEKD